jgi:hypothetical protein
MIGIFSYLFVYVLVPFGVYGLVVSVTDSKVSGVLAGVVSTVAAILFLEVTIRRCRRD